MKVGLRTRLRPGSEDAYEELHRAVPGEVLDLLGRVGITEWVIFRDGLDLFHCITCDDYERAMAVLADDPADQRWQATVAPHMEVAHDVSGVARDRIPVIFEASW